jgi:hypothetical protein
MALYEDVLLVAETCCAPSNDLPAVLEAKVGNLRIHFEIRSKYRRLGSSQDDGRVPRMARRLKMDRQTHRGLSSEEV